MIPNFFQNVLEANLNINKKIPISFYHPKSERLEITISPLIAENGNVNITFTDSVLNLFITHHINFLKEAYGKSCYFYNPAVVVFPENDEDKLTLKIKVSIIKKESFNDYYKKLKENKDDI